MSEGVLTPLVGGFAAATLYMLYQIAKEVQQLRKDLKEMKSDLIQENRRKDR